MRETRLKRLTEERASQQLQCPEHRDGHDGHVVPTRAALTLLHPWNEPNHFNFRRSGYLHENERAMKVTLLLC
jgi:hypothetical protein